MIKFFNLRRFSLMMALLLVFSVFGGAQGVMQGFAPVAAYAAEGGGGGGSTPNKGIDALWDTVGDESSNFSIGGDLSNKDVQLGTAVSTAKKIAQAVTSVLTIISFASFLFWVAKLAMSAGNPQTRRVAISGILFSGVALALFGGAWIVVSFFWNLLAGI